MNASRSAQKEFGSATTRELSPGARRYGLLITGLAPAIPQVLGSVFNIWYNAVVIAPLLVSGPLRRRFALTVIIYNALVYPLAIGLWLRIIFSARPVFHALAEGCVVPAERLEQTRRRIINLPWIGAGISSVAWLGCIPAFIVALLTIGDHPFTAALALADFHFSSLHSSRSPKHFSSPSSPATGRFFPFSFPIRDRIAFVGVTHHPCARAV